MAEARLPKAILYVHYNIQGVDHISSSVFTHVAHSPNIREREAGCSRHATQVLH